MRVGLWVLSLAFPLTAAAVGCEVGSRSQIPDPPAAAELRGYYTWQGGVEIEITGNVARVTVVVDPAPYERGGDLWLKGLPYLFLFSQGTKDALDEHPGLGGVRVVTRHPNGDVIAQALLDREGMTEYRWRQALHLAGRARQEATERPGRMRDLVEWGEDWTEFEYNSRYISSR
jgi:hypothetical protein